MGVSSDPGEVLGATPEGPLVILSGLADAVTSTLAFVRLATSAWSTIAHDDRAE